MNTLTVDVVIIGAGTAGMAAYRAARSHGKRVLLIEGGPYGTTCARVGCMPSKLLIAAAEAAHAVAAAPGFGVMTDPPRIDGRAVMGRVRSERDRFVGFVLESVENIPAADRLRGMARFLDANRLQVDDHTIVQAAQVVIATGSSAIVPPELQGGADRVIICDGVFEWDRLPASVAVIGTGIIGLELGQALTRLGVRVMILGRSDGVAHLSDPDVLACARTCLAAELDLRPNTQVQAAERVGDQVLLHWLSASGEAHADHFDYVLAATGRAPNVHAIGLEHSGLALDARGVPLFDPLTMQCGASHIFIAGDCDNERPLLHEAADQGRIAGDNAGRYPAIAPGLRRTPLAVAFCDPQIATLGQSYQTLCKQMPGRFVTGEVSFANQGRSRVMLQHRGLLRVYADCATGLFLGAEMIAPRAEHLAHLLAWACQNRMTVAQMLEMPFYHPVVEEGVRTALRDLQEKVQQGCPEIEHCADCTPGV
jgi:dihydrolipoamide dehydrogenase